MHQNFRLFLVSLIIFMVLLNTATSANNKPAVSLQKTQLDQSCIQYCGEGYFYDRQGEKNNGSEHICTKYPLDCGYRCTYGWNIRELVDDTNFTCQEAKQKPEEDKQKTEKTVNTPKKKLTKTKTKKKSAGTPINTPKISTAIQEIPPRHKLRFTKTWK